MFNASIPNRLFLVGPPRHASLAELLPDMGSYQGRSRLRAESLDCRTATRGMDKPY